jgi:hypothetical protein
MGAPIRRFLPSSKTDWPPNHPPLGFPDDVGEGVAGSGAKLESSDVDMDNRPLCISILTASSNRFSAREMPPGKTVCGPETPPPSPLLDAWRHLLADYLV